MKRRKLYIINIIIVGWVIVLLLITESVSYFNNESNRNPKYSHQQHVEDIKPNFDNTTSTEYKAFPTLNRSSGSQDNINLI